MPKTFAVDIDGTITENDSGKIHLAALHSLRHLTNLGHNVIFVTGRSSIEGYLLSVFGGVTKIAVGENGGCITSGPNNHTLLGDMTKCIDAFHFLQTKLDGVQEKSVFPRMTEVVLQRTFDLDAGKKILSDFDSTMILSDSMYAYHINSKGVDKKTGFQEVMRVLSISVDDVIAIGDSATDLPLFDLAPTSIALNNASDLVKNHASIVTDAEAGDGVIEALSKIVPDISEM